MMSEERRSQRRFPRVPAEQAVLVRKSRGKEHGEILKTRTVGLGGCMFVSAHPIGVNISLDLAILVQMRVANARGRVVYQNRRGDGAYEVGVEFLQTTPRDMEVIRDLVCGPSPASV